MMTLADEILLGTYAGVEEILKSDVDVNEMDEYGYTPLIEAAIVDKLDVAELLLNHGALINEQDVTGRTALHWAADYNNYEFCKFLLENKADPNAYTRASQPVLSIPLLRDKEIIKDLLYQYGADLNFAQDFINAKLIGHRFEIEGKVHIVDTKKKFILLDFEGFYLESTVSIIKDSLKRFKYNYAAKHLQPYFKQINTILNAFEVSEQLLAYQVYRSKLQEFSTRIYSLLENKLLFLPIGYEGHAITCIRYGDFWIKCDRGFNSRVEGSVVIYRVGNPEKINKYFLYDLIFKKHSKAFVNEEINHYLGLTKLTELPLPQQVMGNCSWANVEASVPAMLFLLLLGEEQPLKPKEMIKYTQQVMTFFDEWREWDKDRALEECIQSFHHADKARKASKAALLAAVLVEKCHYDIPRELKRAEKIFPVLATPEYQFILNSYIKVYIENKKTEEGDNLLHLFDLAAPQGMQEISHYKPLKEDLEDN